MRVRGRCEGILKGVNRREKYMSFAAMVMRGGVKGGTKSELSRGSWGRAWAEAYYKVRETRIEKVDWCGRTR